LILGLALAFLLDLVDRRIKSVEDLESQYGLRALAAIPPPPASPQGQDARAAFEPYRILRNSIAFASLQRETRIVMITSAAIGEGKTTVAVNLARAAAVAGQRVVLVEADLRRPSFSRHFNLGTAGGGFTSAVVGGQPVADLLRGGVPGLRDLLVLPAGPLPPNSAELLLSGQTGVVLADLRAEADLVILDCPPLLPVADARVLLDRPEVDACILVAREYLTTRDQVRRTRAVLEQHRLYPLGLAVTGVREKGAYEYYGGESDGRRIRDVREMPAGAGRLTPERRQQAPPAR
jgi:capsular exopolysaccharide synthesis family protein